AFSHFQISQNNQLPFTDPKYCSGTIRVGIMDKSVPTMRFGKSLDLPLSFRIFELFGCPVALYLILTNDTKRSFGEVLFDVSSKRLQTLGLIGLKVIVCIHICMLRWIVEIELNLSLRTGGTPRFLAFAVHRLCR